MVSVQLATEHEAATHTLLSYARATGEDESLGGLDEESLLEQRKEREIDSKNNN